MATGRNNDEDSEYHFSDSDEEVSYEVETESPKPAAASTKAGNLVANLSKSKRMLISIGVFFVLLFIVYKLVAPSPTTPSTEIKAASQAPSMAASPQVQQQQVAQVQQPQQLPPQAVTQQQAASQPQQLQPIVQQQPAMAQQPIQQPVVSAPPVQQQVQPIAQVAQTQQQPMQPQSMPALIPVQSSPSTQVTVPPSNTQPVMESDSEKLLNQLQAVYAQKLNDYVNQNKALQDQVQTLNTRVANMETQLNQLVQVLTRQSQSQGVGAPPNDTVPVVTQEAGSKVPYNVQAIIPGRAWLRSDNGETVTVTEGDVIKDLGRVTKIDPYDGVVQINTGSKMISLSYGNGG